MKLKYDFTLADWKAALRLHSRQKLGRRVQAVIRDFVIPTLGVIGLVWITVAQMRSEAETVDNLLVPVAALIFLTVFLQLMLRYSIRRSFKGIFPPSQDGPGYSLDLNEEGILSTRPGVGEARYYWTGICAVAQSKKIILLYISEVLFLGIPIRVLSPEQRVELDSLIERHVPKRKP